MGEREFVDFAQKQNTCTQAGASGDSSSALISSGMLNGGSKKHGRENQKKKKGGGEGGPVATPNCGLRVVSHLSNYRDYHSVAANSSSEALPAREPEMTQTRKGLSLVSARNGKKKKCTI